MNRRGFISAMMGGFVADPERLLWVPGKKLISIPANRLKRFRVTCVVGPNCYYAEPGTPRGTEYERRSANGKELFPFPIKSGDFLTFDGVYL